ncbi:hypothetical protein ATOP_08270 [Granulimonas faecalis]|uniref:Uncharacterized protein n=1 Tax=Granulimonas faecalis TaxID=2894155 RepID=A0AAV5B212_9ACTN|nr:hypothetical protein ATOP_08270 [Granulimonas faecalis]
MRPTSACESAMGAPWARPSSVEVTSQNLTVALYVTLPVPGAAEKYAAGNKNRAPRWAPGRRRRARSPS